MNFGGGVEGLLKGIGASFLTNWFIAILLCVFVLALGMLFLGKWRRLTASTPGLLTSIGILGTFAGIITGLLDFNPSELDKSIGPLLEGLKTAFTSSLVGMALSILFKFISTLPFLQKKVNPADRSTTTMGDLYGAIEKQTQIVKIQTDEVTVQASNINRLLNAVFSTNELSINSQLSSFRSDSQQFQSAALNLLSHQNDSAKELIAKISDDAESSLTGQLKLIRVDIRDGQKEVANSIQEQAKAGLSNNAHLLSLVSATTESAAAIKELAVSNTGVMDSSNRVELKLTRIRDESSIFQDKLLQDTAQINGLISAQREAFTDFGSRLDKQLDKANESLATSPTEHVIEALKKVTREFNKLVVEQFGDNFKHLNEAVGQLLVWQENYRAQLIEMDRQYNESVKAIQQSEISVSNISESAKIIPAHMQSLEAVIKTNQAQVNDINQHLQTFAQLRDKAVEAIPETQKVIENLVLELQSGNKKLIDGIASTTGLMTEAITKSTDSFTSAANDSNSKLSAAGEVLANTGKSLESSSSQAIEDFSKFGKILVDQATNARREVESGLKKSHEHLLEEIQKSASMHSDKASNIHSGLQKTIEESLQQTGESIKTSIETQYDAMANARNQEVQRVMEQMGEALATITDTFTRDYRKLVEAMADVVNQKPNR